MMSKQSMEVQALDMQLQPTINIGLIGHVAHGKSTITKALTGISTARFHNEQKQNMTLRLGYANFKIFECTNRMCPKPWRFQPCPSNQMQPPLCKREGCGATTQLVRHVSLVDSPGHHDLIATMLSGAAVMDGAILVIAADEVCPCPQTTEHLAAASLMGVAERLIVVQNKVDICKIERCAKSKVEIEDFLGGPKSKLPPIIPTAAIWSLNIDVLCQYLVEKIPEPVRDLESSPLMLIVRSFDVNKPGKPVNKLIGGVIGGSLQRGTLKIGQAVQILPGVMTKNGSYLPINSHIVSLRSEENDLTVARPGGLIAVGLGIDPALTKSDNLVGQMLHVIPSSSTPSSPSTPEPLSGKKKKEFKKESKESGEKNLSPIVTKSLRISFDMMKQMAGTDIKPKKPKKGETLLLCVGATKVRATVIGVKSQEGVKQIAVTLGWPIATTLDSKVALFRADERHWRLIAAGALMKVEALEPLQSLRELVQLTGGEKKEGKSIEAEIEAEIDPWLEEMKLDEDEGKNKAQEDEIKEDGNKDEDEGNSEEEPPSLLQEQKGYSEADNNYRMVEKEWPEFGDLVMVKVDRLEPEVGAFCTLLEFNKVGLIQAGEATRQRVKLIKQAMPVGMQDVAIVTKVDSESGTIDLSKKRVGSNERKKHLDVYAKRKIVASIMTRVSVLTKVPLQYLYQRFVWPLARKHLHPLTAFQLALHDEEAAFGRVRKRISPEVFQTITSSIQQRLRPQPVTVRAVLEVSCLGKDGVAAVSGSLTRAITQFEKSQPPLPKKPKAQPSSKSPPLSPSLEIISDGPLSSEVDKDQDEDSKAASQGEKAKQAKQGESELFSKKHESGKTQEKNKKDKKKDKNSKEQKSKENEAEVEIQQDKQDKEKGKEMEKEKKQTLDEESDRVSLNIQTEGSPYFAITATSTKAKLAIEAIQGIFRNVQEEMTRLDGFCAIKTPPQIQSLTRE